MVDRMGLNGVGEEPPRRHANLYVVAFAVACLVLFVWLRVRHAGMKLRMRVLEAKAKDAEAKTKQYEESAMRHATRATKYAEELSAEKDRVQALNKEVQELQRSTEAMRGKLLEHTEENARAVEARNRRLLDLDSRMQSTKFVKVANVESFNDKGSILQQKAKPSRESLSTIPGKISETKTSHAGDDVLAFARMEAMEEMGAVGGMGVILPNKQNQATSPNMVHRSKSRLSEE